MRPFLLLLLVFAFLAQASAQENIEEIAPRGRNREHDPYYDMKPFDEIRKIKVSLASDRSNCMKKPKCLNFFNQRFPSSDGTCNNRMNPKSGSKDRSFKRLLTADYANGFESLRETVDGGPLPSARAISNALQGSLNTSTPFSHMLPFWGQFLVHDMTLTLGPTNSTVQCSCMKTSKECSNIPIPTTDPQYKSDKNKMRTCFRLERSIGVRNSENCKADVREQLNELSAFLDMGVIYGNSKAQATALRAGKSKPGELLEEVASIDPTFGKMLPQMKRTKEFKAASDLIFCPTFVRRPVGVTCRVSGEARTNENSALLSQHTIWMRLHNSFVRKLKTINPKWTSDQLFENTKLIVTSLFQIVTYKHFLPIILGEKVMARYDLSLLKKGFSYGYDSSYDATISNAFATAAFRMGHPLMNTLLSRPDPSWVKNQAASVPLKTSLFNVGAVTQLKKSGGPNSFIRGLTKDSALTFSPTFSDDLRNFLNAPNFNKGAFGSDLLAINIQRGRDHGLPSYVNYRRFCGLSVPEYFADLADTTDTSKINNLQKVYQNVEDIDLYAGGVSERSVSGGTVGPTFACLIADEFRNIKKGDRFWHENASPIGTFNQDQLKTLRGISFSRLLCEMVTDMKSIQAWPFRKVSSTNLRKKCTTYPQIDLKAWKQDQKSNPFSEIEQDVKPTVWFPTQIGDENSLPFTVPELYTWLLVHRPDDVCRQVLDKKERTVNGQKQVQFHCLPGTIAFSDFPPVPSAQYKWSDWQESTRIDGMVFVNPLYSTDGQRSYAIQAKSTSGLPASETGDVFTLFSPTLGLSCYDNQQISKKCNAYRVRYLRCN